MHTVDYMMIGTLFLTILILVLSLVMATRKQKSYQGTNDLNKIAHRLRNVWLCCSISFLVVYYWCVLFSLLSTLVVLYLSCFEEPDTNSIMKVRIVIYSALSVFTTICPYVINLTKLSKKYRKAYCIIEEAILKNGDLSEAIVKGEKEISDAFEE